MGQTFCTWFNLCQITLVSNLTSTFCCFSASLLGDGRSEMGQYMAKCSISADRPFSAVILFEHTRSLGWRCVWACCCWPAEGRPLSSLFTHAHPCTSLGAFLTSLGFGDKRMHCHPGELLGVMPVAVSQLVPCSCCRQPRRWQLRVLQVPQVR